MPFYDYACNNCHQRINLFYKTYHDFDVATPTCTYCNSTNLKRLIGRVAVAKGDDSRLDAIADDAMLSSLDGNDPRALGQFMRKMSGEMGEDLGDEFNEVVDRLEKGQAPEDIEKSMPNLAEESKT